MRIGRAAIQAAACAAALVGPAAAARADAPPWAPCLVVRPTVAAYVAAFEAEGWKVATGPARERALDGPAEVIYYYVNPPISIATPATLADQLAVAHADGPFVFDGAAVLRRGDAVVAVHLGPAWDGGQILSCTLAAPAVPEVGVALAAAGARPPGALTLAAIAAEPPEGARNLQIEALRHEPGVTLSRPLAGAEGVVLQMTFKTAP